MIGSAVDRARLLMRWSLKELAAEISKATGVERDVSQVQRWIAGAERPQFDVLWTIERFREPLVLAIAEIAGLEVKASITLRLFPRGDSNGHDDPSHVV